MKRNNSIWGGPSMTCILSQADITKLVANASLKTEATLQSLPSSVFWLAPSSMAAHFTSLTQMVWQEAIWRLSERNPSVVVCVWYKYYKVKFIFFQWGKMLTLHLDSKLTHDITFEMNISFHWKVWPNLHISSMYLIS